MDTPIVDRLLAFAEAAGLDVHAAIPRFLGTLPADEVEGLALLGLTQLVFEEMTKQAQ